MRDTYPHESSMRTISFPYQLFIFDYDYLSWFISIDRATTQTYSLFNAMELQNT